MPDGGDEQYAPRPLWIAAGIAGTTVLGVVALTAPFVVLPTAKKGLPYMATPAPKLRKAFHFLSQRRRSLEIPTGGVNTSLLHQPHRVFVDLGSGDGEGVYQAVQLLNDEINRPDEQNGATSTPSHYYYQSCIGMELNTTLYFLSSLRRRWFWSHTERARSQFQCGDFWNTPPALLRAADTVLIFGVAPLMHPLSVKLRADGLRPGAHILSYRFPLPLADPVDDASNHNNDNTFVGPQLLNARLIYDEEEMRIYECNDTDENAGPIAD